MNQKKFSKYLYVNKTPTWLVRTTYSVGIFTWLLVIYGYSRFISADPFYWWIFSPILIFFSVHFFNSYIINLFYKQLNLKEHSRLVKSFWKNLISTPTVDVFLPICGEKTDVLRKTFLAVSKINYAKKIVYVLDDKGSKEHELLAKSFGFIYFCRENKGHMKKAGNIKYGFDRSTSEYILIFDADFAPDPSFVRNLLPYMNDPRVAIVQSPQYFRTDKKVHDRSALEYGASHIQEDFYRFIQVARSNLGATVCCGSNAIYRRSALNAIGGTSQIEHSEDMRTGFDLTDKGWRVKYIPIILAVGICPDNIHQYFHQQHRWCSGSLSLMLDKQFWLSKNINFAQKMCFISGFMYYISFPLTMIISFEVFVELFKQNSSVNLTNSLPFIPCLIFSFIVLPLFRIGRPRIGNFIARTASGYAYCHAVIAAFIKKSVSWQPTNAEKTTVSKEFRDIVKFNAAYLFFYITFIGIAIHLKQFQIFNPNYYFVLFWVVFNLTANSLILYKFYLVFNEDKAVQMKEKALSKTYLHLWRLRTAGIYVLLLITVLTFTIR